ncbi:MAG: hypothetical protein CFH19_00168 [Alphaproteobacteria bacterium MarineAlpha5_Bin9]|nr:MAG: hypothetical protein CFH19_00168 [Alphaproteobacteria bacterium MarineAlpha5_Bin9]|tara:strand:+ start:36137 stop:36907 length:771 start_codon:yes stop_codon:yes gene_type:complete
MEKILFKKSYSHNNYKEKPFDYLWNKKGAFTSVAVYGRSKKFLHFDEHIYNLTRSLKKIGVKVNLKPFLNSFIKKNFKNNIKYHHLFRVAVSTKTISISLRKINYNTNYVKCVLINYQRPNYKIKNLKYKKTFDFLKLVNNRNTECIFYKNKIILEGSTTNIVFIYKNQILTPKEGCYHGISLKFFSKKFKIKKKNIFLQNLNNYDEIILLGSGRGVVSVDEIPQIGWKKRDNLFYNKFYQFYKSYINKTLSKRQK